MKKSIFGLSIVVLFLFQCKNGASDKIEVSDEKVPTTQNTLKEVLTLYASFDDGINADKANGDSKMYTILNRKMLDSATVGLTKEAVSISDTTHRFNKALHFKDKTPGYVFYKSKDNMSYSESDWSGAISFWLSLDPNKDLKPGFCDPIQITDSGYNDAGIWVDFTKENPRDFRLGVIGDRNSWNPNPDGPDNENPIFISQLPVVKNPPFASGEWTHILINFSNLNTGNGSSEFYINGVSGGKRNKITDPFTWDIEKSNILLGLSYIGLFDELSIYNRALSEDEIKTIYQLKTGIKELL